jgi:hypothetical protein
MIVIMSSGFDSRNRPHAKSFVVARVDIRQTEQLLRAVKRLPQHELESFIAQIVALRTQRTAPHLNQEETALLLQINGAISPDVQRRFNALVAKLKFHGLA